MNEQDIILLLQQKNEDGLTALTLHYGPLMRYIIAPILPNPQDQEDCLAEVTLRVWDKIGLFDPKRGSWNAWLTAITRNTALNHVRALTRHANCGEVSENLASSEPTPEETILRHEEQRALEKALSSFQTAIVNYFTENITTFSPPLKSPLNWASQSAPSKDGSIACGKT